MGAMRSQAYALSWPDEVKSVICLDGVMLPSELADVVSKMNY